MTEAHLLNPGWNIVGWHDEQWCYVAASDTLTEAQLRAKVNPHYGDYLGAGGIAKAPASLVVDLNVTMRDYLMTKGRTYAEALATLMQQWQPSEPARSDDRGLPSGRPGLPPATPALPA